MRRWAGWQSIDAHERAAGEREGRPRVKLVRTPALFDIAAGRSVDATIR
jgi:ferredoxin/flavodoxin---NADP+ reductase